MTKKTTEKTEVSEQEIEEEPFLKRILDRAEGKKVTPINEVTGEPLSLAEEMKKAEDKVTNSVLAEMEKHKLESVMKTIPDHDRTLEPRDGASIDAPLNRNTVTPLSEKIFTWSIRLSNEQETNLEFIQPKPEWFNLFSRLKRTRGNLIKVVGPQGSGKTTLSNWLYAGLPHKGGKDYRNSETVKIRMIKGIEALGRYEKIRGFETVENFHGGKNKTIITTDKDWSWDYPDTVKTLIIDLWDYSKNSRRDITKALDAIQDYWSYRCNQKSLINIVVFLQKEALPLHFFLGKMEYFEIKPWKPTAMVECYKKLFSSYEPFTKEALTEIAYLSRGIFRNYKRYISFCLDFLFNQHLKEITLDNIKQWITTEKLVQDMGLELCELYPHSRKNREYAVTVLRFLREHGKTPQKTLTKQFFTNKMNCSRLLNVLAVHGYVEFTDEGRERIWQIKEMI